MNRRLGWFGMGVLAAVLAAGPATAAVNSGKVSFSLGMDVTTAYFFRGILQERDGFIGEPYGEISYSLYENKGAPISSVSLTGGLWASLHSEKTGNTGTGAPAFYELDVYGGANVGIYDKLDAGVSYIVYTSPNNAYSKIQEVDFSLGLDDSEWLGPLALNPHALVAIETEHSAFGPKRGTYGELGIEPAFEVIPGDRYPVTLSLPMVAGFSVDNYYENSTGKNDQGWGYASFGAVFSVPLAFIPEEYGSWSATGGARLYTFNTNTQNANKGNDPWVVGTWGVSMTY
jgi:hypothetical protein